MKCSKPAQAPVEALIMRFLIIMFKWVEKYLASKENLINDMMHIQFTQHFFFTNLFAILLFELKRK